MSKKLGIKLNAAGLNVSGSKNPNWKGGLISKTCLICNKEYKVKIAHRNSKFCSLQCVGFSQRGVSRVSKKRIWKECPVCNSSYSIPQSHQKRNKTCSRECSLIRRSHLSSGENNPNWMGGLSRLPYTYDFNSISKRIIQSYKFRCQGPECSGTDRRMTTHHINYNKQDNDEQNLICLCSSCNSKANFNRERWKRIYTKNKAAAGT